MNKNLDGQIIVSGTFFVVSSLALALIIAKYPNHQPSNLVYLITFALASLATHSLIYYIQKVIDLKKQLSKNSK